jgi:hypothetical protein
MGASDKLIEVFGGGVHTGRRHSPGPERAVVSDDARPIRRADVQSPAPIRRLEDDSLGAFAAGIKTEIGCHHTLRAMGITAYLKNGGRLEIAQQMAAHESSRTTKFTSRGAIGSRSTRSSESGFEKYV